MNRFRHFTTTCAQLALPLACVLAMLPLQTIAQPSTWPARPITLVVAYPPGAGADAMARLIAPHMGEGLG